VLKSWGECTSRGGREENKEKFACLLPAIRHSFIRTSRPIRAGAAARNAVISDPAEMEGWGQFWFVFFRALLEGGATPEASNPATTVLVPLPDAWLPEVAGSN
jgi:hypothetical protein